MLHAAQLRRRGAGNVPGVTPKQLNVCRHCGFPIARTDESWTHVSRSMEGFQALHRRGRLSSHLRRGRADHHLPTTAAASPALG